MIINPLFYMSLCRHKIGCTYVYDLEFISISGSTRNIGQDVFVCTCINVGCKSGYRFIVFSYDISEHN